MSDKWYYVQNGERQGPVSLNEVAVLIQSEALGKEDYVWSKGFADWKKIKDVSEFAHVFGSAPQAVPAQVNFDLTQLNPDEKCVFIKVGQDRGGNESEYGPFSVTMLKRLFDENRINGKTYIFTKGMSTWAFLGDTRGFEDVFETLPPQIEEDERRQNLRSPLVARMFIENNHKVFEGICRDISVGGMQVLVNDFPGKVGDTISINVHPENTDHHFVAAGKIVRMLQGQQGFSFRFIDLKGDAINAINSYLSNQ